MMSHEKSREATHNPNRHPDAVHDMKTFRTRALTRIAEMTQIAESLTGALGLPPESVFDVLEGIAPLLLESRENLEVKNNPFTLGSPNTDFGEHESNNHIAAHAPDNH